METNLDGVFTINLPTYEDNRGFFREVLKFSGINEQLGKSFIPKQINHARSVKNTLRGIHVAPWNKIIYVTKGKVQVVLVDSRKDSKTLGKHQSFILGDDNRIAVFVPANFGNSYLVLSETADYMYVTDEEWSPNKELNVFWNDKDLNINWQLNGQPFLSERDSTAFSFSSLFPDFKK